jgi:hypothetical protein
MDVWLDEEKLFPGMEWSSEIEKAVEATDVIIVCLSHNSVTKEGFVQRELKFALDIALEKPEGTLFIIPLRLDDCEPPRRLRGWQYADYFPENQRIRAYHRMLESLKARARHLGLSTDVSEKFQHSVQLSQTNSESYVPRNPDSNPSAASKTTESSRQPDPIAKRAYIWKYGRLLVLFLLLSGFFGPWLQLTSCTTGILGTQIESAEPPYTIIMNSQEVYSEWIRSKTGLLILPLAVGALFLMTLLRLTPLSLNSNKTIIYMERMFAGIAPIAALAEMIGSFSVGGGSFGFARVFLWGFWISIFGNYLAPVNLLLELRSFHPKGQKWPWWTWLIMLSIALPIVTVLIAIVWLIYS